MMSRRLGAMGRSACGLLLLIGGLMSCRPAGSPKGAQIIGVRIDHFEGSYHLAVWENGHARHTASHGHGLKNDAKTVATRLDGDDLDSLAKILRQRNFCELKAAPRDGVPDEARPRIEIHYGGLDCAIEMWDGQWHENENARESLEAVEALAKRVKDRGD
jgi:hypothetical protein